MEIEEKRRLADNIMDRLVERPRVMAVLEEELGEIIKEEGGITFLEHEGDLPSKIRRRKVTKLLLKSYTRSFMF